MTVFPLISASDLAQVIANPDRAYVIVDCRFRLEDRDYGEGAHYESHIPGAMYLSLECDLAARRSPDGYGGRHPLPTIEVMEETFSYLGIERGVTDVFIYDDSRFAFAARLWWMLRYCGHDRVFILDGGWPGWVAAGLPVTSDTPLSQLIGAKTPPFIAQVNPHWIVDHAQVLAVSESASISVSKVAIVDSRSPERYRGEVEPIDPYAGHIPGAIVRFWQGVTDDAGYARSPEEQWQRWHDIAGIDRAIVYCGSGVTACVNLLSIELARHHDPSFSIVSQLYTGSWSDWCAYITEIDDPRIARTP